jgi:hypothetical protein
MNKAEQLLLAYEDMTWDNYVTICDAIVRINPENLEEELTNQPVNYSHWSGLLARARSEMDTANFHLTQFIATTTNATQEEARLSGKKKTAKDLDAFVESHPEYAIYTGKVNTITQKFNMIKGLVSALDQRMSSLVQLSSAKKAEMKLYS